MNATHRLHKERTTINFWFLRETFSEEPMAYSITVNKEKHEWLNDELNHLYKKENTVQFIRTSDLFRMVMSRD